MKRWLAERRPSPPLELAEALGAAAGPEASDADSFDGEAAAARLLSEGVARLERAMADTGRVRESAFHLLAADALITYACEAALASEDPDAALIRILTVGDPR